MVYSSQCDGLFGLSVTADPVAVKIVPITAQQYLTNTGE
jgi:hypothetical protein